MRWKLISIVLVVLAFAVAVAILYGTYRWKSNTNGLYARMEAARVPISPAFYDPRELEGLPAPVQRYFQTVLKEGQAMVAAVSIKHAGTFNMSEAGERWKPFNSTQRVVTQRPGFVWDARIHMAPGMPAYVHDAYVEGEGILTATVFGLLTVMKQPDTPELAHGELMRFFAEAAWYPTALLPSQGVVWEAIDNAQSSATLTDGATTVKLVFQFDADGRISTVHSDGRYREVDGKLAPTPWQGRFWDYEIRDGMLVPLEGEVAWLLSDGVRPYWRGRIQQIQYELGER